MMQEKSKPCWKRLVWMAFRGPIPISFRGGMQQRTAIARALAYAPSFLLMDEPFAALDHFTRTQLQKELIRLQKSQNTGILFVTHSIDEALLLGHKIAFIEDGCIQKEFLLGYGLRKSRFIIQGTD